MAEVAAHGTPCEARTEGTPPGAIIAAEAGASVDTANETLDADVSIVTVAGLCKRFSVICGVAKADGADCSTIELGGLVMADEAESLVRVEPMVAAVGATEPSDDMVIARPNLLLLLSLPRLSLA